MARNRVTYQSEALFVSGAADNAQGTVAQLDRIQSANYSFQLGRTDVNQFGQVGRIDSLITEAPTVSLDFSYLLTDGYNEQLLGFDTSGAAQFTSGIFTGRNNKNGVDYYIKTVADGVDAHTTADAESIIAIGNAGITEYSFEASVGAFPTASVSCEAGNIEVTNFAPGANNDVQIPELDQNGAYTYDGVTVNIPASAAAAANEVSALRPSDMVILFQGQDATAGTSLHSV